MYSLKQLNEKMPKGQLSITAFITGFLQLPGFEVVFLPIS
jgi:hypothetical protein